MKRWSVISSLSLPKSERTAYCRKNLYDNKTLSKPFCFPLHKTTLGKRKKLSYKCTKRTLTKPADACKLNKRAKPLNYIYPHKAYSKHMFVFVILFYHNFAIKSIVRCTRSCTPDYFSESFLIVFVESYCNCCANTDFAFNCKFGIIQSTNMFYDCKT